MRKSILLLFLSAFILSNIFAQSKQITVEENYGGIFRTEGLDALKSLKNGKQYTILNLDRFTQTSTIDQYDYKTIEKAGTIVSSANLQDVSFSSYSFSVDESKVLLATDVESIFRRSTLGLFFVYDIASKNLTKISEKKVQEPSFSPSGNQVAYVSENNIFLFDIATKSTKQLTADGVKNNIINGETDWVYEEEFSIVRAFEWNSDGTKIAYLRFDETQVPEFSMDIYGNDLYQRPYVFKYPKAGENNSVVTLHLYDIKSGIVSNINLGEAYYIPRIKWMNDANYLSVQTINRHQNELKPLKVNAKNNEVPQLLNEKDEAYVDIHDNSPFNYPELLKGKYLLVHGTGDDNVHVQNSMRMIEALVQANKQVDWAIYSDKNHLIKGGNTRIQLFNKLTDFVKNNL